MSEGEATSITHGYCLTVRHQENEEENVDNAQPKQSCMAPLVPQEDIYKWKNGFDLVPNNMPFLNEVVAGCNKPTPNLSSKREFFFAFTNANLITKTMQQSKYAWFPISYVAQTKHSRDYLRSRFSSVILSC